VQDPRPPRPVPSGKFGHRPATAGILRAVSVFPRTFFPVALSLLLASACAAPPPPPLLPDAPTAREVRARDGDPARGATLLADRQLGRTGLSCGSCHTHQPGGDALRPAPPLAGAATRAGLWSGHAPDLPAAVGMCAERYLAVPPDGEAIGHLVAAIRALPGETPPETSAATGRSAARTFARAAPSPREGGRPEAGAALYARACAHCHEAGAGPALKGGSWPPDAVVAAVRGLDRPRHPGSLMPPFPVEVLSDDDLRDLAAWIDAGAR
jgi:mono/diheme cytochrome c family protein